MALVISHIPACKIYNAIGAGRIPFGMCYFRGMRHTKQSSGKAGSVYWREVSRDTPLA